MTSTVLQKDREIAILSADNASLKLCNEKLVSDVNITVQKATSSKLKMNLIESVPKQYLSIAMAVVSALPQWASSEISELKKNGSVLSRNWANRGELVNDFGLSVSEGLMIAPYPPEFLISRPTSFTPSYSSEKEVLDTLVRTELSGGEWSFLSKDESWFDTMMLSISSNKWLTGKVRQVISDTTSLRKRAARDLLFETLGYGTLLSRHKTKTAEDISAKSMEIVEAKDKLLLPSVCGNMKIVSTWRTCRKLSSLRCSQSMSSETVPGTEENLNLGSSDSGIYPEKLNMFGTEMARSIYREFVGFNPTLDDEVPVEVSILFLIRLDAWICTVLTCLTRDEVRGGKRQKEYSETFSLMLKESYNQLIGKIRAFVLYWEEQELVIGCDNVDEDAWNNFVSMERKATCILKIPSLRKAFISVRSDWFNEYICSEMGIVHDCFVAELDYEAHSIILLGIELTTGNTGARSSPEMDIDSGLETPLPSSVQR